MDSDLQTWAWLAIGLALLAGELAAPHLVTGFFGVSALVVAAARALGLVEGLSASLALWGVTALGLLLALRSTLATFAGVPEVSHPIVSDDARLYGSVVEVVTEIVPGEEGGRIRLDGTSWPAKCDGYRIRVGEKVRLVRRENLVWIVEPAEGTPLPPLDT